MSRPADRPVWDFSALEFTVLWRSFGRDVLPYPLRYHSTEESYADYEQAWKTAAATVHAQLDESLYTTIRLLAQPEARLEMYGYADAPPQAPSAPLPPGHRVRVHTAVSARHALILTQHPADDRIRLELVPAQRIPARLITLLPSVPPGTAAATRFSRTALDPAADSDGPFTGFTDDAPRSPRRTAQRFFARPRSTVVHLAAYPGPAYDNRPAPARAFHILDYPEGRYTTRATGPDLHTAPADTPALTTLIHRNLDATLRHFREEAGQL